VSEADYRQHEIDDYQNYGYDFHGSAREDVL